MRPMRTVRSAWLICCGCGLAVAAVAGIMGPKFPKDGAGYPEGLGDPIFAFEMAASAEDLALVFGPFDDPRHAGRIAQMDEGNHWDYAFMLVYATYLWTFYAAVRRETGRRAWLLLGGLAIAAALSDVIENGILLGLTADLAAAPNVEYLAYPVWFKFLSLMICGLGTGVFLLTRSNLLWRLAGVAVVAGSLAVAAGFVAPDSHVQLLGKGLAIVWNLQLIYAIVRVFVPVTPPGLDEKNAAHSVPAS